MVITAGSAVLRSTVSCGLWMLEVGLTATRNTTSLPLLMPPLMPPAWLVRVWPCTSSSASFTWLPLSRQAAKPSPNSMPLMAGMAKTAWLMRDSTESKNGSPRPADRPVTRHSTSPPTESPTFMAAATAASISAEPPASSRRASTLAVPRSFLATTPAATRAVVSRPEKWPLPRISACPPYLRMATQSAWPGRGVCLIAS